MTDFGMISVALLFFTILLIFRGIQTVPQGMEYTVERLGKYVKTLSPGFHIINPFLSKIGRKVNKMEQVLDVPFQEIITRDNVMVRVDGVMLFQILNTARAAYVVNDLNRATLNLTMTNIRTVMSSMELDELLSKRDDINSKLLSVVNEATSPWGVKINRIEIKDIIPPEELVQSMARQMKTERDKHAEIQEAEGIRQANILKAEGEKQAAILKAEGDKEAAFRDAEARERWAQAEAKATIMVSQAISRGNVNAINYFIAQRYTDALKSIASSNNSKIVMIPLEASNLIGSIEGIHELTKAVKKDETLQEFA
jgi:regulator of protease activity HflC (stomatin/prohibitin superfamily)